MKKLFLYCSYTGNGEVVSEVFKSHNYDVRKVIEKKKMPKSFFLSMMQGGFRASIHSKGKLVDYSNDVSNYEEIVIGGPIWNARLTPTTNAILKETNLSDKKLTFIFYSGSGTGKKTEKKIKKLFPEASIIFLKEPKKHKEELEKLNILFK
ncbi:MAG: hypothetical protein IJQ72_05450 [Bacilli bacterium]|nr:hypothetical protein [Bacilli bacterium]